MNDSRKSVPGGAKFRLLFLSSTKRVTSVFPGRLRRSGRISSDRRTVQGETMQRQIETISLNRTTNDPDQFKRRSGQLPSV